MADNELKERIDQLVEQHRDEIVSALSRILQFNTVSGACDEAGQETYRSETERCLKYLEDEASRMGLTWRNHDNQVALAELSAGDGFIGLPVHVDVVPPGDGWTHGAFDGAVADETVWGRGCQDDKGPVIQMLWAVNILKMLDLPLQRGARVIIGTAEECGDWADMKHYFEVEPAPEFSIVPDAVFPIINGEKGLINLRVRGNFDRDEFPNVGGFRFSKATAGERANIVPPVAELEFAGEPGSDFEQLQRELERFLQAGHGARAEASRTRDNSAVLTFYGKSAHGSTPQEGHNAAIDLLLFMTESGFVSDDEADIAEFLYECGKDFAGERLGLKSEHAFLGPTTVNLGILRWTDETIEVVFNIRNTLGLTVAEAQLKAGEKIAEFVEETGFEMQASLDGKTMDPIYVDPAQHPEFIGALKEAYTTFTGRDATLHAIGGTTYSKVFPRAVCFGPVDLADEPELAHQVDERIKITDLLRNVKIYAYAIAKLCS